MVCITFNSEEKRVMATVEFMETEAAEITEPGYFVAGTVNSRDRCGVYFNKIYKVGVIPS